MAIVMTVMDSQVNQPAGQSDERSAAVAGEDAAILQTAGQRQADVLQAAGIRDADALQATGLRDAEVLAEAGKRSAAVLTSEGQRNINLLWENTQMKIALRVVSGVMVANLLVVVVTTVILLLRWQNLESGSIAVLVSVLAGSLGSLTNMGSLVIGFYFGRTNHTRTGGVQGHDATR